jgi:hypothetical protein
VARKDIVTYKIASAQSLAASFTTIPTLIKFLDNVAYQIITTTTNSTGTFSVQVSLDYAINEPTNKVINPGTWTDLTLAGGVPSVASANDTIAISLNQLPYNAIRLAYTSVTAGTGTIDAFITCKQVGG